jgi:hypothetical protein
MKRPFSIRTKRDWNRRGLRLDLFFSGDPFKAIGLAAEADTHGREGHGRVGSRR